MKISLLAMLVAGAATLGYGALQTAEVNLVDDQMGLSKSSVFDDPSPEVFQYPQGFDTAPIPPAYSGAPTQIPHKIEEYLPINARRNMCTNCHEKPCQDRPEKNQAHSHPHAGKPLLQGGRRQSQAFRHTLRLTDIPTL